MLIYSVFASNEIDRLFFEWFAASITLLKLLLKTTFFIFKI